MNEHALLHMPNSKYCFAVSSSRVGLRIRVARDEKLHSLRVIYGGKYEFASKQHSAELKMSYADRLFEYYTVHIDLKDVRLVYVFHIIMQSGEEFFYSEDGLTNAFDYKLNFYNAFQLPYINKIDVHKKVEWSKNAVFYQIFIDRFAMGDMEKDQSYINLKWGDRPSQNSYAGGDIKGIMQNIDYIQSLGVNTIYLTPIFKAQSNHKYNISDYKMVDREFGSNADFRKLVDVVHSKNMKIVLDAVFNHCSNTLKEFEDVEKHGKDSPYFEWFIVNGDIVTTKPCNYETFATCEYMPKLNTSNLEVQQFLLDIAMYWLREYAIDGWRLDVSDEISHNFWKKFKEEIKRDYPDAMIIGENWHDAYPFLQGDEYDSIMNYAFTKASLDLFAFGAHTAQSFANKLNELLMRNTDTVNDMMLNLLDSHDTFRFFTEVKCNQDKLIAAIAIMYFYPGMPMIYYGTEHNMEGNYDPDCRRTFDWNLSKQSNFTKSAIIALSELKNKGMLSSIDVKIEAKDGMLVMERSQGSREKIYLCVNLEQELYASQIEENRIIFSHNQTNCKIGKFGFIVYR